MTQVHQMFVKSGARHCMLNPKYYRESTPFLQKVRFPCVPPHTEEANKTRQKHEGLFFLSSFKDIWSIALCGKKGGYVM